MQLVQNVCTAFFPHTHIKWTSQLKSGKTNVPPYACNVLFVYFIIVKELVISFLEMTKKYGFVVFY